MELENGERINDRKMERREETEESSFKHHKVTAVTIGIRQERRTESLSAGRRIANEDEGNESD